MWIFFLLIAFGYVCGSIPFGKIAGRLYGVDIQKHGSGNIGFANTARVLGKKLGLAVLVGDVLKGIVPVLIAKQYLNPDQVLIVTLATIAGHIFPLWLRLKGGKGVATGLGVTLVIAPVAGLLGLATYLLGLAVFRKSAPSSIIAAWSLPLICAIYYPKYSLFYLGLAVVVLWTHRVNIQQMAKKHLAKS